MPAPDVFRTPFQASRLPCGERGARLDSLVGCKRRGAWTVPGQLQRGLGRRILHPAPATQQPSCRPLHCCTLPPGQTLPYMQTAPLDLDTPLFYPTRKAGIASLLHCFSTGRVGPNKQGRGGCSLVQALRLEGVALARHPSSANALLCSLPPHVQDAIEECLDRIAAGQAPAMLRSAWEQHRGVLCRGVNWDRCGRAGRQLAGRVLRVWRPRGACGAYASSCVLLCCSHTLASSYH